MDKIAENILGVLFILGLWGGFMYSMDVLFKGINHIIFHFTREKFVIKKSDLSKVRRYPQVAMQEDVEQLVAKKYGYKWKNIRYTREELEKGFIWVNTKVYHL